MGVQVLHAVHDLMSSAGAAHLEVRRDEAGAKLGVCVARAGRAQDGDLLRHRVGEGLHWHGSWLVAEA
jgi:hypothetical protein